MTAPIVISVNVPTVEVVPVVQTVPVNLNDGPAQVILVPQPGGQGPPGVAAYYVDAYGADPTGAASSDAAVAAALADMGSSPGVLVFGAGTYKLAATITLARGDQGVQGQGMAVTTLNWVGTGDCIRMYDPTANAFPSKTGLIAGLKIEGFGAGAGSAGIHVGDTYNLRIRDLWIADFHGAGSIGALFDNTVTITERAKVAITVDNCTTAVVFQVEDNSTPSFDYSDWDFIVNCFANQDGVVLKGYAQIIHGNLSIRGDCYNVLLDGPYTAGTAWAEAETNTGVLLIVGTGGGTAFVEQTNLTVSVECAGITDTAPCHGTINIGAGADIWCTGTMSFRFTDGFAWTPGTNDGFFAFAGYKNVDATYGTMTAPQTASVTGALVAFEVGNATGSQLNLNSGNTIQYFLAAGVNALTLNYAGMTGSAVWDISLVNPSSGVATVTFPGNVHVMPDFGTLSLALQPNGQTLIRLVTFDMATFYVFPVSYQAPTVGRPQYWEAPPNGGVATLPRVQFNSSLPTVSGQLNLAYFTAPAGIGTTTEVAVSTGGTAAADITLAEAVLFSADDSGNLTLVASADISTVITSTFANVPVSLHISDWVPGQRYAAGCLIDAGTMPQMQGAFTQGDANYEPILCSLLEGPLTSVPSSIPASSLFGNFIVQYIRFS